jgi:hypothetical protein
VTGRRDNLPRGPEDLHGVWIEYRGGPSDGLMETQTAFLELALPMSVVRLRRATTHDFAVMVASDPEGYYATTGTEVIEGVHLLQWHEGPPPADLPGPLVISAGWRRRAE